MSLNISQNDIRDYNLDGVMVLRSVLSPAQVNTLRRGIDYGYEHPSEKSKIASGDSDTGKFFEDFRCWSRVSEYRDIIFCSALPRIAAQLMQSTTVRLHHDHMLIKEAKTQQRTPWHQDIPYYNVEGNQTISFWIPVDPVPEDSAMEFITGSHQWSWTLPRTFKDNQAKWFPPGSLPEMPDFEAQRGDYPIVSWALQPGDCLAFNFNTMHAAKGSTGLRRALSIRYTGDDVVFAPRPWVTSPPFPELVERAEGLVAGGKLTHSLFPLVYSSAPKL